MHATFKPHHFLDLLCDMGRNNGNFDTENPYGHSMGYYGNLLAQGKIDTITFTSGADDPCKTCKKLSDGICEDVYSPKDADKYGFSKKYDYNMKLDTGFNKELPLVFSFGDEKRIDMIFELLDKLLTSDIILLNWPRDNRVELTYRGLDLAKKARDI